MAQSVKASSWARAVPVGVAVSAGAGAVLSAIVGASPIVAWQTNVGGAVVIVLGTLATGSVAGARTAKQGVQAAVLTFAGLLAIAIVAFVYAVGMEPPR